MANLDTENKRRSATGVQALFTIPPKPDGTITVLDRQQVTYIYAGIEAAPTWTNITIRGINVINGEVVYIIGKYK